MIPAFKRGIPALRYIAERYARNPYDQQKVFNEYFQVEEVLSGSVSDYLQTKLDRVGVGSDKISATDFLSESDVKLQFQSREVSDFDDIHSGVHSILTASYANMFAGFYSQHFAGQFGIDSNGLGEEKTNLAMTMTAAHDIARANGCPDHNEHYNAFYLALILRDKYQFPQEEAIKVASHIAKKDDPISAEKSVFSKITQCADSAAISRVRSINFDPKFLDAYKDLQFISDVARRSEALPHLQSITSFITDLERSSRANSLYSQSNSLTSFDQAVDSIGSQADRLPSSEQKTGFLKILGSLNTISAFPQSRAPRGERITNLAAAPVVEGSRESERDK